MSWSEIDLPFKIKKPILAVGADIKNSLCFAYRRSAFINEVINDLEIPDNFKKFQRRISLIPQRFGLSPRIIAYDKHPGYFSTKYILDLQKVKNINSARNSALAKCRAKISDGPRLIPVQHHHAHIASCMLENKLSNQRVIGVAFDGTGFGSDSTLWGAEFLVADYRDFKRAAHLRYIPLLGGKKAIYEPWRVASAWLCLAFGNNFLDLDLDFLKRINKKNWIILEKMWRQNFNSPPASSIGRLFDAIACLVLEIYRVGFEAEAAINLERLASGYKSQPRSYQFAIKKIGQVFVIDPVLTLREIIADLKNDCSKEEIAACFHLTVADMIRKTCLRIRGGTRINTVILTGGVFQNKILLKLSLGLLEKAGFHILTHKMLPCSDISISLGQAAVASWTH